MANDKYTIEFTRGGSFNVYPYTSDGPRDPTSDLFMDHAVRASTTLRLHGKGMVDYGDDFEQNFIYLLEHFANCRSPSYPIVGQMWYKSGDSCDPVAPSELFICTDQTAARASADPYNPSGWTAIILADGSSPMTGSLDLGNNTIVNVANPISSTDGLNLGYADARYINVSGDTMVGSLILNTTGDPGANDAYAVPKGYITSLMVSVNAHINDTTIHITPDQNTFLDSLVATLTADEVNTLDGINTNVSVQTQLDDKVSKTTTTTMANGISIVFDGGTISGLPNPPTPWGSPVGGVEYDYVAVPRKYVNDLVVALTDKITNITWINGTGTVSNINDNIIRITATAPDGTNTIYNIEGVSRVGHTHAASTISFDNTSYPTYPTTSQLVFESLILNKAPTTNPTFSGTATFSTINTASINVTSTASITGSLMLSHNPTSSYEAATKLYVDTVASGGLIDIQTSVHVERSLEVVPTNTTFIQVPRYLVGSSRLFLYVNGVKQYGHTFGGTQDLSYVSAIDASTPTYLDTGTNYYFNITVDGVGPTLVTIAAGSTVETHGALITTVNTALVNLGINAIMTSVDSTTDRFQSKTSGSTASILIEDPNVGSPLLDYLFITPTALVIISANFMGDFSDPNPLLWVPDEIIISGDVTSQFTVGRIFTIYGSTTDYGSYDGAYSVHTTGASYNGGTNETTIPIASNTDQLVAQPLLSTYSELLGTSPAPSYPVVSTYGSVNTSNVAGLESLGTPLVGINGDYKEVNVSGSPLTGQQALLGTYAEWVEFNYVIDAGKRIEANVLG